MHIRGKCCIFVLQYTTPTRVRQPSKLLYLHKKFRYRRIFSGICCRKRTVWCSLSNRSKKIQHLTEICTFRKNVSAAAAVSRNAVRKKQKFATGCAPAVRRRVSPAWLHAGQRASAGPGSLPAVRTPWRRAAANLQTIACLQICIWNSHKGARSAL